MLKLLRLPPQQRVSLVSLTRLRRGPIDDDGALVSEPAFGPVAEVAAQLGSSLRLQMIIVLPHGRLSLHQVLY